jgi:hypothetical protein
MLIEKGWIVGRKRVVRKVEKGAILIYFFVSLEDLSV